MFVRIASFTGGDTDRLKTMSDAQMESGELNPPAGIQRAMLLADRDANRRLFVTFFDSREAITAAEARFESMGDEMPEDVRGQRTSVDVYEVIFDQSM